MKDWQAIGQFNCFRIKRVLRHDVGTQPSQLLEEELEGPPYDRRRRGLISRSRHHQRLICAPRYWNFNEIYSRHLRAFGTIEENLVSAPRQPGCQVAQEGLCTAQLSGLKRGHERSNDRDLQWLCWI